MRNLRQKIKIHLLNSSTTEGNNGKVGQGNRGLVEGFLLGLRNKHERNRSQFIQIDPGKWEGPPETVGWDRTRENKLRVY